MAKRRQTSDLFRGFVEEAEKIARKEKEGSESKKEKDGFLAAKTLGLLGAGAGVAPGALHHLREVEKARELFGQTSKYPRWFVGKKPKAAITSERTIGLAKPHFEAIKHSRTRFDIPALVRRSLGGAALVGTTGGFTGALIDYLRRKREIE